MNTLISDQRSSSMRHRICRILHWMLIGILAWLVIVAFISPRVLVDVRDALGSAGGWLWEIPYVRLYDNPLRTTEVPTFVGLLYLCFLLMFLNLFAAIYPPFFGRPRRTYVLSFNGFTDFQGEAIYAQLRPSISLNEPAERLWGRPTVSGPPIEAESFREIIAAYLTNRRVLLGYGLLLCGVFIFFPWAAHRELSQKYAISVLFAPGTVLFVYGQVRSVFELLLFLFQLIANYSERSD